MNEDIRAENGSGEEFWKGHLIAAGNFYHAIKKKAEVLAPMNRLQKSQPCELAFYCVSKSRPVTP